DREVRPTPNALGREVLELPGSPTAVLATVAGGSDALLIIDQLDAVSIASGRQPQFFECIAEIIREAGAESTLHVLAVCRDFDFENDSRFRTVAGDAPRIRAQPFEDIVILDICKKLGIAATRLSKKQVELLSVPLHLALFAESRP